MRVAKLTLDNGAHMAIIGCTPAGSFLVIFASSLAWYMGKVLNFTIYGRNAFLNLNAMKKFLPSVFKIPEKFCHCFPKISVGAARQPFARRITFVRDASSTRLYKENETIVKECMQRRTLNLIPGGKVKVVKNDNVSKTVLALFGNVDIFDEMILLDATPALLR